jgi:hypothetical protein
MHLVIGLAFPLFARGGEEENWQRLRAMPREQRVILADRIRDFERLGRDEKAAVRALDRKIDALPPPDQANYYAVLRRYHLWLHTLTDDQRKELDAAPTDRKMGLVAKFRAAEGKKETGASPVSTLFQLADPWGRSPFEMAHNLEVWFALGPAHHAELEKLGMRERTKRMNELSRQIKGKVRPLAQLTKPQEDAALKQLDKQAQTKGWLRNQLRKSDTEKQVVDKRRLANNFHFLANPPKPVQAVNLLRFETAMPSWFRATFDHLPPEEARRRLTVLYRLIYPFPNEIPAGGPSTAVAAPAPAREPKAPPSGPGRPPAPVSPELTNDRVPRRKTRRGEPGPVLDASGTGGGRAGAWRRRAEPDGRGGGRARRPARRLRAPCPVRRSPRRG